MQLAFPFDIEYNSVDETLILIEYGDTTLFQYSYITKRLKILDRSISDYTVAINSILLNTDGSLLYFAHKYGLSVLNMKNFTVRLLLGVKVLRSKLLYNSPPKQGPFAQAAVGRIENLDWLVPEKMILATKQGDSQAVLFIDLVNENLSAACVGKI